MKNLKGIASAKGGKEADAKLIEQSRNNLDRFCKGISGASL